MKKGEAGLFPRAVRMLDLARFSRALRDRVKRAEPDAIAKEGCLRLPIETKRQQSPVTFNCAFPGK